MLLGLIHTIVKSSQFLHNKLEKNIHILRTFWTCEKCAQEQVFHLKPHLSWKVEEH